MDNKSSEEQIEKNVSCEKSKRYVEAEFSFLSTEMNEKELNFSSDTIMQLDLLLKKSIRNSKYCWLYIAFFAISAVILFVNGLNSENLIYGLTCCYVGVALGTVFFLLVVACVYYCKMIEGFIEDHKKICGRIYQFFIGAFIIPLLPLAALLKLMNYREGYRAKTIDNFAYALIVMAIDLMALVLFLNKINTYVVGLSARKIAIVVDKLWSADIELYPLEFFAALILTLIEWNLINLIILQRDRIIIKLCPRNIIFTRLNSGDSKSKKYSRAYVKVMLKEFQLVCLIILFLIATFDSGVYFGNHQSDAINVITIFTLFMLYLDKRKTHEKELIECMS